MSATGIKLAAAIFQQLQLHRIALLRGDKQDILLGQMMEDGKEAMKHKFIEATNYKEPDEDCPECAGNGTVWKSDEISGHWQENCLNCDGKGKVKK